MNNPLKPFDGQTPATGTPENIGAQPSPETIDFRGMDSSLHQMGDGLLHGYAEVYRGSDGPFDYVDVVCGDPERPGDDFSRHYIIRRTDKVGAEDVPSDRGLTITESTDPSHKGPVYAYEYIPGRDGQRGEGAVTVTEDGVSKTFTMSDLDPKDPEAQAVGDYMAMMCLDITNLEGHYPRSGSWRGRALSHLRGEVVLERFGARPIKRVYREGSARHLGQRLVGGLTDRISS